MTSDDTPARRMASQCLAGRVRVLNRVVTGIYDDALRPYQVRVSQMNILVAITVMGTTRAAAVCKQLRLEKSTLSRDLDRLLDRGWVRATPGAGRTQLLEATDAGRALIAQLVPVWEAAQARVQEVLGAALTQEIHKSLERLRTLDSDPI